MHFYPADNPVIGSFFYTIELNHPQILLMPHVGIASGTHLLLYHHKNPA